MKKRLILTTLLMLFVVTIPTKADFWKKLKNAITGTGSNNSSSSSNSSGKSGDIYLDHKLAMYIWDNQLTVTTLAMKNGKAENGNFAWFDSTNPEAEIFINGKKFN